MVEQILKELEKTNYKIPQTVSDLIDNNSIIIEVIDKVIKQQEELL